MRSGSPEKSTLSNRTRRVVEYTDNFGNLCQRVLIPKGAFEVRCSCRAHTADTVDVEPKARFVPVQELPESALQFLLPSRYCQSDLLNELASSIVGQAPLGYQQLAAIEQWLRSEMRYVSGSSNAKPSAVETATSRTGVCRDYAHLGISLTRSLNIPARMVVGYLYDAFPAAHGSKGYPIRIPRTIFGHGIGGC
jgi:transglutaminase-like putative cysteine protease